MPAPSIRLDRVGKRFSHGLVAGLRHGFADALRRCIGRPPPTGLRPDEFWALRDVCLEAGPAECLGIIGPNGAGKSTLLKLVNGEYRADHGQLDRHGALTSLIRLGSGLQPLLTGRENIQVRCAALGYGSRETAGMLPGIARFAELGKFLDFPVRRYSDGMYARLEFAIATAIPCDILLIDEVLAVGDMAFQARSLRRLQELKRSGTTILFVSHSEMNVRAIADRCLLLFDGEVLALGDTGTLFRRYYEVAGLLDRALEPMGLAPEMPGDFDGTLNLIRLSVPGIVARTGETVRLRIECQGATTLPRARLVLQFWSPTGLLLGVHESLVPGEVDGLGPAGSGRFLLELPSFPLAAGVYRLAGGFRCDDRWQGYRSELLTLVVSSPGATGTQGLVRLPGALCLDA